MTVDSSQTISKRQGSAIRKLPLRHQGACAIGTMLSAGVGGRMPGVFQLALLGCFLITGVVSIEILNAFVPDRRSESWVLFMLSRALESQTGRVAPVLSGA